MADALRSRNLAFEGDPQLWATEAERFVNDLAQRGIPAAAISVSPPTDDPLLCLARGNDESHCEQMAPSSWSAYQDYLGAENTSSFPIADLSSQLCAARRCDLGTTADAFNFAASGHLTRDFTLQQVGPLETLLTSLVGHDA